jgi:hypothetical protein
MKGKPGPYRRMTGNRLIEEAERMNAKRKEVVIPREQAVFRLDERGRWWHLEQGLFQNPRIIGHFHACIQWDEQGYHLAQDHRDIHEKVYFPYADTALFVFEVIMGEEDAMLVMNTGRRERLRPRKLFIQDDNLYMRLGEHRVRFTGDALVRISDLLEFDDEENAYIRVRGRRYRIPEEGG